MCHGDRIDFMELECFHESGLCHWIGLTSWNTNVYMHQDCSHGIGLVSWNTNVFMNPDCVSWG